MYVLILQVFIIIDGLLYGHRMYPINFKFIVLKALGNVLFVLTFGFELVTDGFEG